MLFVSDSVKEELSKSSTILQCALSILDFECNRYHHQPQIFEVEGECAMIDMDKMNHIQIMEVCMAVNRQFKRSDNKPTCYHLDTDDTIVICETAELSEYSCLL